ncbi:MAG: NAD(P)H-dependent oxidoreductase [Pseudomonadota bacterium]
MVAPSQRRPFIVGVGGVAGGPSSTERALVLALAAAEARGAETRLIGGDVLASLPLFVPRAPVRSPQEALFLETVRRADGLILASPGYHGGVSGLVKNALDLLEETAADARVYLTGMPVGLIATAYGWQATGSTIAGLRAIVHALRGWPTPLAAAVNSLTAPFSADGACADPQVSAQLATVGAQVADFLAPRP